MACGQESVLSFPNGSAVQCIQFASQLWGGGGRAKLKQANYAMWF